MFRRKRKGERGVCIKDLPRHKQVEIVLEGEGRLRIHYYELNFLVIELRTILERYENRPREDRTEEYKERYDKDKNNEEH